MNRKGICGVKTYGLILDTWKGCWWIQTVGRWPWKSASAKECVTTHQPNPPAPKMDDASALLVIAHYPFGKGGITAEQAQPFQCRCGLGVRSKLMAWASDGPASSADLGWRSKDLTENYWTHDVGYWSGEGFRGNGNRTRVVRKLSTTLYRFVRKVKVRWCPWFTPWVSGHIWKGATENLE